MTSYHQSMPEGSLVWVYDQRNSQFREATVRTHFTGPYTNQYDSIFIEFEDHSLQGGDTLRVHYDRVSDTASQERPRGRLGNVDFPETYEFEVCRRG